jgi:hypothetical protein
MPKGGPIHNGHQTLEYVFWASFGDKPNDYNASGFFLAPYSPCRSELWLTLSAFSY